MEDLKQDLEKDAMQTQDDSKSVSLVTDRFNVAKNARVAYEQRWDRWYRMYRSYRDRKKYDYKANLFVPYSFWVIETEMPRIISTIFASSPFVEVVPREQSDVGNADAVEKLLDFQLMTKIGIVPKMVNLVKQSLIYGTSVAKVYWRKETRKRKVKKMVSVQNPIIDSFTSMVTGWEAGQREETVTGEYTYYDDPDIDVIDLYDFYKDPGANSIEEARWCIHRTIVPLDHLKDHEKKVDNFGNESGVYINIDKVEDDFRGTDSAVSKRLQTIGLDDIYKSQDKKTKMVELLEYWENERVIVVANRKTVIRDEETPYWHMNKPFIEVVDQPVPQEFYGIGELEPIESLQREMNDLRNQRMDNVNLILNRMMLIRRGAGIDRIISQPGGKIMTNDMNAFQFLQPPDVTASSYNEAGEIGKDIQNVTGVTSYASGINESGQTKTAGGINIMQQAASARFNLKIRLIESMFLEPMCRMIIALDQQFIDKGRSIRILGEGKAAEIRQIRPEEIQGEYDFTPVGSAMQGNREIRLQQMIGLKKVLADDPTIKQGNFNKRILKYSGEPAVEELVRTPEEMKQLEIQKMAQEKIKSDIEAQGKLAQPSGVIPKVESVPGSQMQGGDGGVQ